jgi:hypothetical protein
VTGPRFGSLNDPDALRSLVQNLREAIYITTSAAMYSTGTRRSSTSSASAR